MIKLKTVSEAICILKKNAAIFRKVQWGKPIASNLLFPNKHLTVSCRCWRLKMSGSKPWHFWTVWQHGRLSELRCRVLWAVSVPSLWSELPPDTGWINSMAQLQAGCCGTSLRWRSLGETAYGRPLISIQLFFILNLTCLLRNSSVSLKCTTDPLVSQQSA